MPFFSPRMVSGVVRDDPGLAAEGAYLSTDKTRLRRILNDILAEIIGGWEKATADTLLGKGRAMHVWEDLEGQKTVAIGTHRKLYVYTAGFLWDITPVRDDSDTSGTLSDPFDTTDTDETVTVNHTAHGLEDGGYAYLKAAAAVGGITFGAAGTYSSNPLQTVQGSTFVIVSHTAHGLSDGEFFTMASATATGGVGTGALNTTHRVYVLSPDAFQIEVSTAATSSATGGGTPTYEYYHGFPISYVDADTYTVEARSAATSTVSGGGGTTKWKYEINPGLENTTRTAGYSTGTYSSGYYSLPSTQSDLRARVWHFSNFGQNLLANYRESPLYRWQNNLSQSATALGNDAPQQSLSHMVVPERFIVALGTEEATGSTFDAMRYAWASQEAGFSNGDWTPAATNTAGDNRLAEGTRIVRGMPLPFVSLIWTDTALYQLTYLQDTDFVFGAQLAGTGCGLIGPNAAVAIDDVGSVVWLSSSKRFFMWAGGSPTVIDCPVRDYLFDDLAPVQEDLIFAGHNSRWNEVWWFYPTAAANETAAYIAFNYRQNLWFIGTFDITAWGDVADSGFPIAAHADGTVQLHERDTGTDNGDAISWHFETAPVDIQDGGNIYMVDRFMPDTRDMVGGGTLIMKSRFWANGAETSVTAGTFNTATESLAFRAKGRQIAWRVEGNSAPAKGRFGRPTFNVKQTGERR